MVKELDLQLALGMSERRYIGSLPAQVGCRQFESRTDPKLNLSVQPFLVIFPLKSNISWKGL